jgi:hypothetical protein
MTPQSRGFVTKAASSSDARGAWPGLPAGHGQAEVRWTVHLASVRNRFFDHIDVTAVTQAADALSAMASRPAG